MSLFTSFKIQASCKAQGVKTTESKYHSWLNLDVISWMFFLKPLRSKEIYTTV